MIETGQHVPNIPVKLINKSGVTDTDTKSLFAEGLVVFFAVPGAYTPTCHNNHLPGYIAAAQAMREAGVDRIICGAVNDHHVVKSWSETTGALGAVEFLADGNADFATALGLSKDMAAHGMATRFARSAMIVKDGVIQKVFRENAPGEVTISGAPAILEALKSMPAQ